MTLSEKERWFETRVSLSKKERWFETREVVSKLGASLCECNSLKKKYLERILHSCGDAFASFYPSTQHSGVCGDVGLVWPRVKSVSLSRT